MNDKQTNNDINEAIRKLNKLNDIDFDININISDVIRKADQIKNKRKDIKEFILFLTLVSFIVLLVSIFIINGFNKIILYAEIIFLVLSPYMIIPAAIIKKTKEAQ